MLAGALTSNNAALVSSSIGRQPTDGELYIAHFLGADGAGKLINGASKIHASVQRPCFRTPPRPTAQFSTICPVARPASGKFTES